MTVPLVTWRRAAWLFAVLVLCAAGGAGAAAQVEGLFPFVVNPWNVSPGNITDVSGWLERPAGREGFVRAEGGGFVTGDGRPIRFLGVNLSYGANFPTHEQAEALAARLARFGINLVRLHHYDRYEAPDGIWLGGARPRALDPEMLDRLDYLVAQLKARGIYVNFNLKTARTLLPEEGFPYRDERPVYDKGIDMFHPAIIEEHKRIYRELLLHVNPYTGNAYAHEPAVAMIEISNENGLFYVWQRGELDAAPAHYMHVLDDLWTDWLRRKYGTTEALQKAWGGAAALHGDGVELLANGDFRLGPLGWLLQTDAEGFATWEVVDGAGPDTLGARLPALRLSVIRPGRDSWIPQVMRSGLTLEEGQAYRIVFWLRVDGPAQDVRVNAMLAVPPYTSFWAENVAVGSEWREYAFDFRVPAGTAAAPARVTFTHLAAGTTYWIAGVSLQRLTEPAGLGLPAGESLETGVTRPAYAGIVRRTAAVQEDYIAFLYAVDRTYFEAMYRFLKEELGVRSLVTGTQVPLSPPSVQANLDYVDVHMYFKHPQFPAGGWDALNWYIENVSMVNSDGGTIPSLAGLRVAGKPFVVSEYNHPAPNTYGSEAFLLAGAYGAYQDWSGLVVFDWSLNRDFDAVQITNYFNIKGHPAKLVTLPAVHALFVRGDVSAARQLLLAAAPDELSLYAERGQTAVSHAAWSRDVPRTASLVTRVARVVPGIDPGEAASQHVAAPFGPVYVSDTGELTWDRSDPDRSLVLIDTERSKAAVGYGAGRTVAFRDGVVLEPGPTRQDGWSAITLTVIDGEGFAGPAHVLVTATGYVQNTGMAWEDLGGGRVTLRNRWGTGPVLVEGIPARVRLPVPAERVTVYALDMSGNRSRRVPVAGDGSGAAFTIGPEHRTLWYEVVID